jgi:hypothetical protein
VLIAGAVTGVGAMAATNAPMAMLGVSDPCSWTATDRLSDAVPHLAYGVVAAAVGQGLDRA